MHTFSLPPAKKPEKKPPCVAGAQGLLKSPMTTLWLGGKNWYSMMSPTLAVTELGLKERPFCPTAMVTVAACVRAPKVETVASVLRCILTVPVLVSRRSMGLKNS